MARIHPRVAAFSGILFALLLLGGLILTGNVPADETDQKAVDFWADSGNRVQYVAGAYCLIFSALCFLVFLLHMRDQLADNPRSAPFAPIVFASGLLFSGMVMAGAIAFAWLPASVAFGGVPAPQSGDLARFAPELAYSFILAGGGLTAFACLGLASIAALRSGSWASWLAWSGLAVAVLQIADVMFLPYFLLVLWVLVASVAQLVRGTSPAALPAAQQA